MALITSAQAARRLGVKVETLYAYVSRGLLERHGVDGARHSLFDADAVDRLARRGRPRAASRSGPLTLDIDTAVTSVHADGHRYRGRSALELASIWSFEQVAEWLWSGREAATDQSWPVPEWASLVDIGPLSACPSAGASTSALPVPVAALVTSIGTAHLPRLEPGDPHPSVAAAGRDLIAAVVDRLPVLQPGTAVLQLDGGLRLSDSIAGRLWGRLTRRRPTRAMVSALNAALVLMADHELASSTLAVRAAVSTRADPAAAVLAGLGVLSGRLHGGESQAAAEVLRSVAAHGLEPAVSEALERHGRLPGFGHRLYPDGDPRAVAIIDRLRRAGDQRQVEIYDALAARARNAFGHPNCDLALAALANSAGFGDPQVIFTVARIAGWLAHAQEEYGEAPLRFRPRATYVGD